MYICNCFFFGSSVIKFLFFFFGIWNSLFSDSVATDVFYSRTHVVALVMAALYGSIGIYHYG